MEYVKITPKQFMEGLKTKKNMLVYGKSGIGKTATVYEYAEANGLKVVDYDLAGRLPEEVAGIPAVKEPKIKTIDFTKEIAEVKKQISKIEDLILKTDDKTVMTKLCNLLKTCNTKLDYLVAHDGEEASFYKRTLDEDLDEFFKAKGEGYILLFDEVNQGSPDTLNTLYRITHPNPSMRKWAGHDISKCQIVACGNMSDGTDGTVYLTDLPTPLVNRFFVFQLVTSNKETTDYLKKKYKNIPQVAKYIKVMLDANISPRDVDLALDILQYDYDAMFLESKLGAALTAKIYDIQKGIRNLDPAELIKNARKVYEQFKEDGEVMFGPETITSEDDLKRKFEEFLSDEEIKGVMKGDE